MIATRRLITILLPALIPTYALASGSCPFIGLCNSLTRGDVPFFNITIALIALGFAVFFYKNMMRAPEGNDEMKGIAASIRKGANAYLLSQYRIISIVFAVLFVVFLALAKTGVQNPFMPIAFLTGGFFSGLCGYIGMKTATNASSRTAQGARESLDKGLQIAFHSGAVMGLVVVGFGLLDISLWYLLLDRVIYTPQNMADGLSIGNIILVPAAMDESHKLIEITTIMVTFGIGASTQALFARVGGGIYTKAADVGADLVGKVEAGIPEDDPRNPATIADNVGDNVGDVAGMGADLYESYYGSIIAAAALGATIPANSSSDTLKAVTAPMIVAGLGILVSIAGIFLVHCKEHATQKNLLRSLLIGTLGSSVLVLAVAAVMAATEWITWGVFGSITSGLLAGVIIGQITEYYTSDEYKPTKKIAEQANMGAATTIIEGFATGMLSTGLSVIAIVAGIICAFTFAGGFENMSLGLYGIGFAAVGMLATLGITLATDAYGPIADNAGGNAEMSHLGKKVRDRTDALDSLGNTTAATGKGFAIGSAALTAMALLAAYIGAVRNWVGKLASEASEGIYEIGGVLFSLDGQIPGTIAARGADIADFLFAYNLTVLNPKLICGLFLGAMMAFVFCALTMKAVGKAASAMVSEVRRQFRESPGILKGETKPDYESCVAISTKGAQKAMILPSLLAIIVPVATGLLLEVAGVVGLLVGSLTTGFVLAITLNNAGGAWDNAKKFIEKGNHGGKGSDAHKAAVAGDTIGDPFKDTSGPSLNILIKLMTMVSLVFTGLIVKLSPIIAEWLNMR